MLDSWTVLLLLTQFGGSSTANLPDCWKKYQWPQICRCYHFYGRKQRITKEPLDEGERGEWKSWLKAQHSENKHHGIRSHHFMVNRWRNSGNSGRLLFGLPNHCRWWLQPWNLKTLTPWKESYGYEQPRLHIKEQRYYFANKGPSSPGYSFSSSHVWIWELDYKESWALKNDTS